ncbi:MAG TPA: sulfatase [Pirellulales bacterium]
MNVLLYVIDSLRADHVSCLNGRRSTTPTIDRLAAEGVLFSQCFAQGGWTLPSAAAMFSGQYPRQTGVRRMHDRLAASIPWLPELLRDRGWRTALFTAMYQVSTPLGFGRGFDHVAELFRDPEVVARRQSADGVDRDSDYCLPLSEDLHAAAIRWLDAQSGDEPFFMAVWSIDAHEPFRHPTEFNVDADPEYRGPMDGRGRPYAKIRNRADLDQLVALYDGGVRYQDAQLGKLIEELRARDLLDDTLIVVVADHGEMFFEHGLHGHGKFPWDAQIRVPLVMRCPQVLPQGVVSDGLVDTLDLAPTILDLLGLEADARLPGVSLRPLAEERCAELHQAIWLDLPLPFDEREEAGAAITREWKYVEYEPPRLGRRVHSATKALARLGGALGRPGWRPLFYGHWRHWSTIEWLRAVFFDSAGYVAGKTRQYLFDRRLDPGERTNVARRRPEVVETLAALRELSERPHPEVVARPTKTPRIRPPSNVAAHLQQLGYVDRA